MIYIALSKTCALIAGIYEVMVQKITVASWITICRIGLIFPIHVAIMQANWSKALVLLAIAAFTDGLDGFVARKRNECTRVGAALDAIADKLLVVVALASCVAVKALTGFYLYLFVLFLIMKECMQVVCAFLLTVVGQLQEVKPHFFGKSAMVLQLLFIALILYRQLFQVSFFWSEFCLVFLILFCSTASAFYYFVTCLKAIKG
jgi:cardiolipin synthase (CMP-forming)